jgi:branched-chain amino acid transport system ATP-binding protein
LASYERARLGCARTWQGTDLFDDLDVRENLAVAAGAVEVDPTLAAMGLDSIAPALPSELSEGQRKLVGFARAVVSGPRLLCLDEPAAGLDSRESRVLGRRLRALADRGQSTLLIDHDMGLVLGICDRVVVLEFGKVIANDAPEVVRRDPAVIAAYLGGAATPAQVVD